MLSRGFHPYCELFPLHDDTVVELAENMAACGWAERSVVTVFEGQILDGKHRYLAAQKAGVKPVFTEFKGDASAALRFVMRENLLRRHLSLPEKKELFIRLRNDGIWPKREPGGDPSTNSSNETLGPTQTEIATGFGVALATIKRWEADNEERVVPIRASTTGCDEWFTPGQYIEMAREVMGAIDLDPAGCDHAQPTVQATKYYTQEDDGLVQPWSGRVWLNPPYSKGLIDKFVDKLCREYEAGNVSEAVVLVHNFTDSRWCHNLMASSAAVCFTRGRIKFYTETGVGNSPTSGNIFFYFGPNVETFAERFGEIGFVYENGGASFRSSDDEVSEVVRMRAANAA